MKNFKLKKTINEGQYKYFKTFDKYGYTYENFEDFLADLEKFEKSYDITIIAEPLDNIKCELTIIGPVENVNKFKKDYSY